MSLKNNLKFYYLFYSIKSLLFYVPILVIYLTDILQNSFQVGIALTTKSISVFLLEVPLGYIADKFGRKRSLFFSIIINIFSFLFLIISPNFYTVIIAEIFFSISETLFSGADIALIYDNFKHEDRESYFAEFQRNSTLISSVTLAVSFFLGSLIYSYNKKMVFILTIFSSIFLLIILNYIKEHPYNKNTSNCSKFESIKVDLIKIKEESVILKEIIIYTSILTSVFMAIYFYILPIELNNLQIKDNKIIYGLIYAFGVFLIGLGGKMQKYIKNKYNFIFTAGLFLIPLMFLTSYLKNRTLLIIFILIMRFLWGAYSTNNSIIINKELIDSSIRATVFSIKNAILNIFLGGFFLIMGFFENYKFSNFSFLYFYICFIVILFIFNMFFLKQINLFEFSAKKNEN